MLIIQKITYAQGTTARAKAEYGAAPATRHIIPRAASSAPATAMAPPAPAMQQARHNTQASASIQTRRAYAQAPDSFATQTCRATRRAALIQECPAAMDTAARGIPATALPWCSHNPRRFRSDSAPATLKLCVSHGVLRKAPPAAPQ